MKIHYLVRRDHFVHPLAGVLISTHVLCNRRTTSASKNKKDVTCKKCLQALEARKRKQHTEDFKSVDDLLPQPSTKEVFDMQGDEDFKSVDFPQPQPFTKEVFDDAIAMIKKWDFTIEKGS